MCAVQPIAINLVNECLWKTFGERNEMIVNKKGRNIFPMLACTIGNLVPTDMYTVSVRMVPFDKFKYRFENGSWKKQSFITEADPVRSVGHPDGYKSGMEWMEEEIHFPSLKISNDRSLEDPNTIFVQPNQMYTPCIDIWQLSDDQQTETAIFSYGFEAARFIAVTAYKDKKIVELKKMTNKHAAGKRKRSESSNKENQPKKRKCLTSRAPSTSSESSTASVQQLCNAADLVSEHLPPVDPFSAPTTVPAPMSIPQHPNNCNFVPLDPFDLPATLQDSNFPVPSDFNAPIAPVPYSDPSPVYPLVIYHAANFFIPLPKGDH